MTKTITIHVDDKPIDVVLRHATVDDGMTRGSKLADAFAKPWDEQDEAERKATTIKGWWASCTSCVVSPEEARSMDFETFRFHLYEDDMNKWLTNAFVENPHWLPLAQQPDVSEDEKKRKTMRHSRGSKVATAP
jgi:hypothetical protein